jgi:hypothetical protein
MKDTATIIKEAKQAAAIKALDRIRNQPNPERPAKS